MKTKTTIILALLIGATTQAHAYQITAPPEIVAAAKLSGDLARDVMDFGPRCRAALIYDLDDKTPCEIIGEIARQMQAPADKVITWLRKAEKDGATTVTNMPDNTQSMREAGEMFESLVRLNSYGEQQ